MNIKKLNEELEDLIIAFQLNEMAIYYGTDHGTVNDVQQAYKQLLNKQEGMYHTKQYLKVYHTVSQQDINNKLFKPIQKGVTVTLQYPIVIVWGEADKKKGTRYLQGHDLVHILQGHSQQAAQCFNSLKTILNNQTAKPDKYGNYTIKSGEYRFSFSLQNKEDGCPDHAVLITAFKK